MILTHLCPQFHNFNGKSQSNLGNNGSKTNENMTGIKMW